MSRMKKLAFYAILPAMIAGLFSLAPKLYDIATEPKVELTYTVTRGPELGSEGQYRRITSVKAVNSGKRALHHLQAELKLPSGGFEGYRVQESSGLRPNVRESKATISVEIGTLHPKEDFTIVAMALIPDLTTVEQLHLRSDEVLGKKDDVQEEKKKSLDIIGAILSGFSVFAMAVILARKGYSLLGLWREDIIFYLFMRLGLTEISDQIKLSRDPVTYLRAADILLDLGLRQDEDIRAKCLKGLKCLLLIDNIARSSLKVVEQNIRTLSGKSYSFDELTRLKKHSTSSFGSSNIREKIDNYISNPESFTPT